MIYIDSASESPYYNFALEYYLMTEKELDEDVLMLWRTKPTLMLGRFQNIYSEINIDYAKSHNINIVRRKSGGGCIYTDMGSWQFTFIVKNSSSEIDFLRFVKPVVSAIREMGAEAGFTGRNDLLIEGKKFSGNAQYHIKDKTLHHGSILFSTDIEEMLKSSLVNHEKYSSKAIKSVRDRVANISDYLDSSIDMIYFRDFIIKKILGENYENYELSPSDIARIREIEKEEFDNWDKIYAGSPKSDFKSRKYMAGLGSIEIFLKIKGGLISALEIYGDFFGEIDMEKFCAGFIGIKYDRDSVKHRLNSSEELKNILGIEKLDSDELLELFF